MGKRVNFSARTVITIDANLAIDQWGVPRKIAMNLTIPEIVTEWNREEMLELIRRGPNVHPGAKSVTKMNYDENGVPHPEEWSLRCGDRTRINLEPGDIVMRHVRDGDVCMFNRQPSVHRMSMMGHRVKVIDGSTFRFNVSVCKPYNADFDGDKSCLQQAVAVKGVESPQRENDVNSSISCVVHSTWYDITA
jgi:DNA-directed RNA polymerase beta' subunit